ncbi:MAG: bifunctional hydroxymethylpyrimidine kinase/phosphomethylpyrimidine kinase [Thermoleophilaceae bacterium]|nr:bifunctional hydroxymethylpyrimidine kinase/phosphomethylpyrimidine kinase [Thermoleophilaceae bacterium]
MTSADRRPRCVLSIAGSDSGGGAGIQADLKAFARCGVHGMTAVTAITAQSTVGVTAVHPVPAEIIVAQVAAVADDIGVDAVKIGMLGSIEAAEAVERALDLVGDAAVVVDPVMVAESGASLIDEQTQTALRERLLPRATVVTPNVAEARVLAAGGLDLGQRRASIARTAVASDLVETASLAEAVYELGPRCVVVTGGHAANPTDAFFEGNAVEPIPGDRYPERGAHGSGCTHSSALAAYLALGHAPLEAAKCARAVASEAVRDGLRAVGDGAGPVDALGAVRAMATASSEVGSVAL